MPPEFVSFWLLAQHWRWKHLGDRFGGSGAGLSTTDVVLLVAVVVLAVFAVFVLQRYVPQQNRGTRNDPNQLFRDLCRAHGLGGADRRLLKRLAAWRGLSHPAIVFVMPECFETATLPPELQGAAHDVMRLRVRLFDSA
jgi:hypothetical protein